MHHLAQQLALGGHQVWVVYSLDTTSADVALDVAYKVIWVKHIDVKTLNVNIISVTRAVYQLGKEVSLDIIHGNGEEAFFLPWVARLLKTKFVCTTHAPTIVDHGFFSSFCHPIQLLKELNLHLFRSTLKRCDCIITYSEYSYAMVRNTLRDYPGEKVCHVTPGIHHSWFEVEGENSNEEQWSITFFGRIEYEKGVDTLLYAFKKVSEKYPRCVLNIIGEGNWEGKAKRLSQVLHLGSQVIFRGWKELSDLQKMVGMSTLCVLPSRVESFGITIVETMGSGRPLITTRAGAIPEKARHGETALLVSPGDSDELADTIIYALEHPSEMEKMGERARREAKRFSYSETALQQVEIYQGLLKNDCLH